MVIAQELIGRISMKEARAIPHIIVYENANRLWTKEFGFYAGVGERGQVGERETEKGEAVWRTGINTSTSPAFDRVELCTCF